MEGKKDKEYTMTCNECHKFMSEMMNLDRENIRNDFRKVLREELNTKAETIENIKTLKSRTFRLTVSDILQWGTIGYIIIKTLSL